MREDISFLWGTIVGKFSIDIVGSIDSIQDKEILPAHVQIAIGEVLRMWKGVSNQIYEGISSY